VRPALRGDGLEARTWISSVMAAKCLRSTELARKADGQVVARGRTTWGFIEMATGRPRRIPDEVRAAFDRFIHPEVTA
jgi:acyl-CoA thioester hydrolase